MIRRAVMLLAVCAMCMASFAYAADLPSPITIAKIKAELKKKNRAKNIAARAPQKKVAAKTVAVALDVPRPAEPADGEINLSWVLDPLVANSDGSKHEDSASQVANLIVTEPGILSRPYMVIELSGHVVKTTQTTARIDIQIGQKHRTVTWKSDDVQSGKFKISLIEKIEEGQLPGYFPVSALAFVTKEGGNGAAMVSLEKVVLRMGKIQLSKNAKDPATSEVTGSILTK